MKNKNKDNPAYLEERLLDYANLFETTARLIRDGHGYSNEYLRRIRRLLNMIDDHKLLDTMEITMRERGEPIG
jgi:hypothetical protein